ncbi:MAG: hypothetical protein H0V89_06945 [Deltaproteobacteria bacterium]|nr:hypothetical protein [Deltaproteobacteria bacterium]
MLDESARLEDLDGDGILDLSTSTYQEMRITWGPMSRWSGPPDVTVQTTCGDVNGFASVSRVQAYPDLDGDGTREVWIAPADSYCPTWYFPLPIGPSYAPESDAAAIAGLREMQMVADETGDGESDVWIWQDRAVHAAPVVFAADVVASEAIQVDEELYAVYPTAFDLDGDGLAEFVGLDAEVDLSEVQSSIGSPIDPETGEVLVVVPGGAGLVDPDYATAWDIDGREFSGDDVFLEAGVVSVLVSEYGEEVIVVDLGAGTAP